MDTPEHFAFLEKGYVPMLNEYQRREAIWFFQDCLWADMDEEDFEELTPQQIDRGIRKFFSGGVEGFINAVGFGDDDSSLDIELDLDP